MLNTHMLKTLLFCPYLGVCLLGRRKKILNSSYFFQFGGGSWSKQSGRWWGLEASDHLFLSFFFNELQLYFFTLKG